MTVAELIQELSNMDATATVRVVIQPSYPLVADVDFRVDAREDEDAVYLFADDARDYYNEGDAS